MDSNDLGFDDDFMATMMGDFLDESQIYLANLNDNLLVLDELVGQLQGEEDSQIDLELLNEMFRDAHSLKGLSAMLQLSDINRLTHNVENVFDAARDQTLSISSDVVELMFQAFDRLATMVENLKSPSDEEIEYQSIVDEIQEILKNAGLDRKQGSNSEVDKVLEAAIEEQASSPADETADRPATCDDPLAGIEDEEEISSKYLSIFIGETEESLDLLSEQLLADGEIEVDPLLVNCHRIKGSAASIGLKRSAKLAHLMEDLLQDLRDTNQSITSEISDALLTAVDSLREFVEQLKSGNPTCDSFSQAYKSLSAVQDVQGCL